MSHAFLVFPCSKCGQKIFAEHAQAGKRGTCPLCGASTIVGAGATTPAAKAPPDRRRARRVPIANARVVCESKTGEGRTFNADDMPVVEDISESGIAFHMKGESDRKKLAGFAPPSWLKVGETVNVTLHIPQLFRPRHVKAVVRRVVPVPNRKDLFKIGAQFAAADEQILKDLRKLLESK